MPDTKMWCFVQFSTICTILKTWKTPKIESPKILLERGDNSDVEMGGGGGGGGGLPLFYYFTVQLDLLSVCVCGGGE